MLRFSYFTYLQFLAFLQDFVVLLRFAVLVDCFLAIVTPPLLLICQILIFLYKIRQNNFREKTKRHRRDFILDIMLFFTPYCQAFFKKLFVKKHK